jgi:hypothetical protein
MVFQILKINKWTTTQQLLQNQTQPSGIQAWKLRRCLQSLIPASFSKSVLEGWLPAAREMEINKTLKIPVGIVLIFSIKI